ncbi:VOC family protein [Zemynaea arenosa]|nr:VOC family protein [Massilia arenosa]
MIDHVSISSRNPSQSVPFYKRCFAPLGYSVQMEDAQQVIWGKDGHWSFALYPAQGEAPLVGQRVHFAIAAPSEQAAQGFYEEAVAQGAESLRAPGPRPDINERYYGTMIRDLDGHTIEVVYWRPAA